MEAWTDEWWDEDLVPSKAFSAEYPFVTRRRLCIVVSSFLFWKGVHSVLSRITNWENATIFRINSLMHSTQATVLNFWLAWQYENVLGPPSSFCLIVPYADLVWCVSLGYFVYDLYKNIFIHGGLDFLIHGLLVGTVLCFWITYPCGHRPAIMNMSLECSTIFLHLYAFLFYAGWVRMAAVFRVVFALVFFMARILFGARITYEAWQAFVLKSVTIDIECCPRATQITGLVLNAAYQSLNWFWFAKIVEKTLSVFQGKSKVIDTDKGLDFDRHRNAAIDGAQKGKKED